MLIEAASSRFDRIVSNDAVLETISDGHIFTEGPVWNFRDQSLTYVDIIGDTIWNWHGERGKRVVRHPSGKVNGLTFDKQGRLLIAGWTSRTIQRLNSEGTITILASHFEGKKLNSPNDIVAKSDGTIFFTDPVGGLSYVGMGVEDLQQYLDFSGVYRIDPEEGTLSLLTKKVPLPMDWHFLPTNPYCTLVIPGGTTLKCLTLTQMGPSGMAVSFPSSREEKRESPMA